MIYLTILLTIFMVLSQKYQIKDLKGKRNTTWKTWNNFVRIGIFVICYLMQLFPSHWQDYFLAGTINILLFEMLINVVALQMPLLYVGKSSEFDKLGMKKWYLMLGLLLISIGVKYWIR